MSSNISDLAIVLARIDYGEKDRILTILTQNHGKIRAIAKSVRSAKSKLAGGIELFAENELVLVSGRGELYTVISSRMKHYYGGIAKNIEASMFAYECLKHVNKLAPDNAGEEYYPILKQLLSALNDSKITLTQIKIWYGLKVLEFVGAVPNLKTKADRQPLDPASNYQFDFDKQCFFEKSDGPYGSKHIKILRHLADASKPVQINGSDESVYYQAERLVSILLDEHI